MLSSMKRGDVCAVSMAGDKVISFLQPLTNPLHAAEGRLQWLL